MFVYERSLKTMCPYLVHYFKGSSVDEDLNQTRQKNCTIGKCILV
jgi:hypothetical protein